MVWTKPERDMVILVRGIELRWLGSPELGLGRDDTNGEWRPAVPGRARSMVGQGLGYACEEMEAEAGTQGIYRRGEARVRRREEVCGMHTKEMWRHCVLVLETERRKR